MIFQFIFQFLHISFWIYFFTQLCFTLLGLQVFQLLTGALFRIQKLKYKVLEILFQQQKYKNQSNSCLNAVNLGTWIIRIELGASPVGLHMTQGSTSPTFDLQMVNIFALGLQFGYLGQMFGLSLFPFLLFFFLISLNSPQLFLDSAFFLKKQKYEYRQYKQVWKICTMLPKHRHT